jgi:hypothetical protein
MISIYTFLTFGDKFVYHILNKTTENSKEDVPVKNNEPDYFKKKNHILLFQCKNYTTLIPAKCHIKTTIL